MSKPSKEDREEIKKSKVQRVLEWLIQSKALGQVCVKRHGNLVVVAYAKAGLDGESSDDPQPSLEKLGILLWTESELAGWYDAAVALMASRVIDYETAMSAAMPPCRTVPKQKETVA